jgi:hypothetical protein
VSVPIPGDAAQRGAGQKLGVCPPNRGGLPLERMHRGRVAERSPAADAAPLGYRLLDGAGRLPALAERRETCSPTLVPRD